MSPAKGLESREVIDLIMEDGAIVSDSETHAEPTATSTYDNTFERMCNESLPLVYVTTPITPAS